MTERDGPRESIRMRTGGAWDGACVRLESIGGAIAVTTQQGELVGATPAARSLLVRLGVACESLPAPLPRSLWSALAVTPLGEAMQWRPSSEDGRASTACLGCTRHALGGTHLLLLMREVSDKNVALSQRLHRQRLEATGRLVATIAHELRAPLASVVFNADVLAKGGAGPAAGDVVGEIRDAAARLRRTIDGLLDFARLGPPVSAAVSLREVLERVASLLRPALRERGHALQVKVGADADAVGGNPLVLEQIFVNLVLNAAEASEPGAAIAIDARRERPRPPSVDRATAEPPWEDLAVVARVRNDGPAIPAHVRALLFEPFFTTKSNGTGIGLTTAREAARELGGDLWLESGEPPITFAVVLAAAEADPTRGGP